AGRRARLGPGRHPGDPPPGRGRVPPALRGGVGRAPRPQRRRQPGGLVRRRHGQGRRHQVAQGHAPVVAAQWPQPVDAGGRRERRHPPGRPAPTALRTRPGPAGHAGAGRVRAGRRSRPRSRWARGRAHPVHLAGKPAHPLRRERQQRAGRRTADRPSLTPAAPAHYNHKEFPMKLRLAGLAAAFALVLGAAPPVQAHKAWLRPSATVLSETGTWVTVDAAVSNDLFYFNHVPLRLDSLRITAPDGTMLEPANPATGKYRSVFDPQLEQEGTYRMSVVNDGLFARYVLDGEPKRWRGSAAEFEGA